MQQKTLEKLINDLNGKFRGFQLIIGSDKISSLVKAKLLNTRKVVSDRDVSTLKYSVSRFAIQSLGFKITDDFFYPYLNQLDIESDKVKKAIDLVNALPEIFLETELFDTIIDFLKNHSEGEDFHNSLLETLEIIKLAFQSKNIPRAFTILLLDQFPLNQQMIFLNEDMQSLPQSFSEKTALLGCQLYGEKLRDWTKELDLYENFDDDESFSFLNFSDQIQETRYALKCLSEEKEQETVVFYPEAQGYETLLYLYQKEFFKDQKIFLPDFEKTSFQIGLDLLNSAKENFKSKYHLKNNVDNGEIRENLKERPLLPIKSIIDVYFKDDKSEYALSVWSELLTQLGEGFLASLTDWSEVITQVHHNNIKKSLKLNTDLNIYSYDSYPLNQPKKIIILGWSEEIFNRVSEKHVSNSVLLAMENTLGFENHFLYKNQARDLFRKEIMYDTNVDKKAFFSKVNLKGDSKYPGIFKILKDSKKIRKSFEREHELADKDKIIRKPTPFSGSFSASSVSLYDTCPYKFYLEKVLGLREEQESEYHLQPLEEGRLLHEILENLKNKKNISYDEFEQNMIDMYTKDSSEYTNWRLVFARNKAKKLWSFFDSERKFIEGNQINVYDVERKFEFYADIKNKRFSLSPVPDAVKIRGSIDRMDVDQDNNVILYDYKRKNFGVYAVSHYTNTDIKPQIFLYYLAAKLGAVGDFSDIVGFQFISLETQTREKGFLFKELLKTRDSLIKEKTSPIDQEKFKDKLNIFEDKFFQILNQISQSEYKAEPKNLETCKSCHWKGICKKSKTFL